MAFFKSFLLAFAMFSKIPVPCVEWNERNMRYIMCAFPFVGLVIALLESLLFICIACDFLVIWQFFIFPLFGTLIPLVVTGGIHFDGFMDTCDALGSHAPKEKKLEILKDSHVGAFAVIGCVVYLLSYFVFVFQFLHMNKPLDISGAFDNISRCLVNAAGFLLSFCVSRFLSALAVAVFPCAKNSGLVHTFSDASYRRFTAVWSVVWLCVIFAALFYFNSLQALALLLSSCLVFVYYFVVAKRQFGGITGDLAGWFVQLCELWGLVSIVVAETCWRSLWF